MQHRSESPAGTQMVSELAVVFWASALPPHGLPLLVFIASKSSSVARLITRSTIGYCQTEALFYMTIRMIYD